MERKSSCGNREGATLVPGLLCFVCVFCSPQFHLFVRLKQAYWVACPKPSSYIFLCFYLDNSPSTTKSFLLPVFGLCIWRNSDQCDVSEILGTSSSLESFPHSLFKKYLFIYLTEPGLSCGTWDLHFRPGNSQLQHVGSSPLTRGQTGVPCVRSVES